MINHTNASINTKKSVDTSQKPIIELTNVGYDIGQTTLVSHININLKPNDMISIIGPNGAGKSTLVKLMLGLLIPTTGVIKKSPNALIGYVPQQFSVPNILPLRVVDLLNQVKKNQLSATEQTALLTSLSIHPLLNKQVIHLSGGETQRVLLARALLGKPQLLILDEPMQGLDPETEELLYQFIDNLPEFLRCAMVVVSHDLHWVMKGSRHVICLNKHLCCEGQPVDIQDMLAFQQLFGSQFHGVHSLLNEHKYQQPYFHKHEHCNHLDE